MSIIGSSWKEEEPTDDEVRRFQDTTGETFYGSKKDLKKRIETLKESNFTSRLEQERLSDLLIDLEKEDETN